MSADPRCPACGQSGLEPVYTVGPIPTHSCLLMRTRDEALAYPLGDLDLRWCGRCGFATNVAFDVSKNRYDTTYEEVQTFSPTFREFQTGLVRRLVEVHGLRDKDVIEIGCGKGEFLMQLCEAGGNRGVGIDPSYVQGRGEWSADGRVRFINELYSAERHGHLAADAIVCRHTLEHIEPVREFVSTLRAGLADREDVLVFFELPDQGRVWKDRAFWDVYYEHCSYFTAGSLERLFLECGFDVEDSRPGFGDQYLLIEARPRPASAAPSWRVTEDLDALGREVRGFGREVRATIATWLDRFRTWSAEGRRAVVWGAGSKGVAFLTSIGIADAQASDALACMVDINPHKQGFFLPGTGHEVVGPEKLAEIRPDVVVVMNGIYTEEIQAQLAGMGLHPELLAL